MMGAFSLPKLFVYVWYENGTKDCAARQDELLPSEAQRFKEQMEQYRRMRVVKVTLADVKDRVYTTYEFV